MNGFFMNYIVVIEAVKNETLLTDAFKYFAHGKNIERYSAKYFRYTP